MNGLRIALGLVGVFGLAATAAADQAIYVGDAIQDYKAAQAVGLPFVGINNGDNPFEGLPLIAEFSGLGELPGLLGWKK